MRTWDLMRLFLFMDGENWPVNNFNFSELFLLYKGLAYTVLCLHRKKEDVSKGMWEYEL